MRQVNIDTTTLRTASGAYVKPDSKRWIAKEVSQTSRSRAHRIKVLAYSNELEDLERLFPTAHNEHRHRIDRKTGHCTIKNCWRYDYGI